MQITLKEIKSELKNEFSYINNYDLIRLYDYVYKTNFSQKINETSVNRNDQLESRLRMFVNIILEKAEPSDLFDIYNFWKFNKENTKTLFESLDTLLVEQSATFSKASSEIIKKIGNKFDIVANVDPQNRIVSIEMIESGNFTEIVEYIYDEFLDKEMNQNGDWKMIANQSNILVLLYNPKISGDVGETKPSDKIEYDSEREKTTKVGEWNGKESKND